MNKKELAVQRKSVMNKYTIKGARGSFSRRPRNAVIMQPNSFLHECGKFVGGYQYYHCGDVKITNRMIKLMRELGREADRALERTKTKHDFITEGMRRTVANIKAGIIIDLIGCDGGDDGDKYEFETDPKRATRFKEDPLTEDITVVNLWEEKK